MILTEMTRLRTELACQLAGQMIIKDNGTFHQAKRREEIGCAALDMVDFIICRADRFDDPRSYNTKGEYV